MKKIIRKKRSRFDLALAISVAAVIVIGCEASEVALESPPDEVMVESPPNEVLRERVEQALMSAADVPAENITVEVNDGVVTLTASDLCQGHECPGRGTPGQVGTVQQSIGAVVRAIPGVRDVQFSLGLGP